jgi:hypothetical protein
VNFSKLCSQVLVVLAKTLSCFCWCLIYVLEKVKKYAEKIILSQGKGIFKSTEKGEVDGEVV